MADPPEKEKLKRRDARRLRGCGRVGSDAFGHVTVNVLEDLFRAASGGSGQILGELPKRASEQIEPDEIRRRFAEGTKVLQEHGEEPSEFVAVLGANVGVVVSLKREETVGGKRRETAEENRKMGLILEKKIPTRKKSIFRPEFELKR